MNEKFNGSSSLPKINKLKEKYTTVKWPKPLRLFHKQKLKYIFLLQKLRFGIIISVGRIIK